MGQAKFRVLVVDDFEPIRRLISAIVQNSPDLEVIAEASDGLGAVQQVVVFQPELVVLDIGLPKMNGIEAARRMLESSPKSKILFVSSESSADFVQAAFQLGASGYIHKAAVPGEL